MILKPQMSFASFYQLKMLNKAVIVHQCLCCKNLSDLSKRWNHRALHTTNISSISSTASNLKCISSPIQSIIDEKNIFRSRHEDVKISSDYVHQHVWKNVDQWWNNTALVCALTGRSYTYRELRKLCGKFATSLRSNKFLPGATVAVVLPNVPEYAIVMLGASEAGVRLTLLNPAYTAYEIRKQLDNSEATAVITNTVNYPNVLESLKVGNDSTLMPIIVITDGGDAPSGAINFNALIANNVEEFEKIREKTMLNAEIDTMVLPYSSGTTGLPKGVEITHRNLVASMSQTKHPEYHFMQPSVNGHQEIVPGFLPMYHIYGMTFSLLGCLSLGTKIICMPQFTSNSLLDVLEKHRITMLFAVPPVIQLIMSDERFTKKHLMSAIGVSCGAAPLSDEFITKFRSKMGSNFEMCQGYGLTESTSILTMGKNAPVDSVGFVIPNTQIRIVSQGDEVGVNLGINEIGEVCARGPQIMKGYFKNVKATEDCMDGEWFKTGDLGYINSKGQLFITGRLKELIKVQGSQVSPSELENLIHGHEKVADAAVVGVPHEKYGEVPKAFVVPKDGVKITEDEIKEFVAKQVVKYKQIAHVVFTDKIAKSPAGKILRKELQKL